MVRYFKISCPFLGLAIEGNQKHGLDQLTMFKKSQSEGLLRYTHSLKKNVCSQFSSSQAV